MTITWAQRCSCGGQGITHFHAEHHERVGPADVDPFAGRACPLCGDYVTGPCPECAGSAIEAVARVRALAADMRTWCSPHNIAIDYAQRIDEALDKESTA